MQAQTAVLRPHPATGRSSVRHVRGSVAFEPGGRLALSFRVEGELAGLRLPSRGAARRSDGLWQHTCFEVFLRPLPGETYYELNLAPSADWAAYRFATRRGLRTSPDMPPPRIEFRADEGACTLDALLEPGSLAGLARCSAIDVGLDAVIEEADGTLSYWALAHGRGPPDFHDPAGFALRFAAP